MFLIVGGICEEDWIAYKAFSLRDNNTLMSGAKILKYCDEFGEFFGIFLKK